MDTLEFKNAFSPRNRRISRKSIWYDLFFEEEWCLWCFGSGESEREEQVDSNVEQLEESSALLFLFLWR